MFSSFCLVRTHLLFIMLAVFALPAASQQDIVKEGHVAFGEGRYDDAANAFLATVDFGSTWDWLPGLVETVRKRKELGNIAPADTHKIAVIFVTERREVSGPQTTSFADVTGAQRKTWVLYFNVLRKTLEAFSNGQWTISFDTLSAISTYNAGARFMPDNPDHLNLEDFYFDRMPEFDSFITLSNTRSPAFGLARRYPYVHGVLYGPHGGMAEINAGTHGFDVLLHEFFHVIEWVSSLTGPAHGYRDENRDKFPGWKGTGEFDYYRWHFANTLPSTGWNRLNHRTRWIPFATKRNTLDSLQRLYASVPLEQRQLADSLVKEGNSRLSSDRATAVKKWEQAVSISPFLEEGLLQLHDHYRFVVRDPAKAKELFGRLKVIRSVNDFYTLDTLNREFGQVAGLWHREDIGGAWRNVTWDISRFLSQSGIYAVTFYYTHGFKALDIDSVSILEDGREVSLDAHKGFSGNVKTEIRYTLTLKNFKPASFYQLRAKVKGNGGLDSYGQIHLLRVAALD